MYPKAIRKDLRRRFRSTGWNLVIYYGIMILLLVAAVLSTGLGYDQLSYAEMVEIDGFGYLLATILGLLIMYGQGEKGFLKNQVLVRRHPMTPGSFLKLLCIFLSVQMVAFIGNALMETALNSMGYSMYEAIDQSTSDSFTMYLYASISAPITEELVFRGFVLRRMRPYGRKFAIVTSAFLFGIFHGNWIQIPFAFLVGLVLAYVTLEHNILWAMVLHMINNLLLSDALNRFTFHMPEAESTAIFLGIITIFAIAALVILLVDRKKIAAYLRYEPMNPLCIQAFFSSPSVITMMIIGLLNAGLLITPI